MDYIKKSKGKIAGAFCKATVLECTDFRYIAKKLMVYFTYFEYIYV